MTGVMRGHCHDGLTSSLMLDMMKRQLNSANWPYCGPVAITGENKVATLTEAIVIDENFCSYEWVIRSILDIAGQPMSTLACMFGDGIQSTELLGQLNVKHSANLILDIHHLRENWQKICSYF